ncbi:hypothetical protein VMCG_10897 [Cytospora schulzeri]|uniref:FAD-binding domain-containing protein n=1 Tax=Cytospora schulzeri TaxID=448051 RepID=A0A423V845_9PEZI|nr:hypothetical protein VMCG_10897 [Valsa malicola]
MAHPIRVAISGGGLAGASLIHALIKHPHLDTHIFESAAAFKESGAAVGIAQNALAALDLIGPSAAESLARAGAVPQLGVRFKLGQGPDQGALIAEADSKSEDRRLTSIVHRAAFLRELLADIPKDRMHASKKLVTVDQPTKEGPITLHFSDGSTHECDVLVGADGIHSTVRGLILGEEDTATNPRNTGFWVVMSLQPYDKAQGSLGKDVVDSEDAREYMWLGDGHMILHNVLDNGKLVQFVIGSYDHDAEMSHRWQRGVSATEMKAFFQSSSGVPHLNKAINELLCEQSEQSAIYLWEHAPARTYASGPICVMGDAAHATTPWQGSGAGMSIEDSLILSTLLRRAATPAEAQIALEVYDRVRRPRTQRIVESSRGTGIIMTGKGEEGLDLAWLKQNLLPRWDFILDFDNKKHRDEALEMMESRLKMA